MLFLNIKTVYLGMVRFIFSLFRFFVRRRPARGIVRRTRRGHGESHDTEGSARRGEGDQSREGDGTGGGRGGMQGGELHILSDDCNLRRL